MRSFIILYCLFLYSNSFAQNPAVLQWQKSYGGSLYDVANDVIILADGSLIVMGSSNSSDGDIIGNHGPSWSADICVLKFDPAGNLLWQRSYGGLCDEVGANIIQTSDGGFIFTGKTASDDGDVSGNHGQIAITHDVWVVKLDATGNIQWQKCYGGSDIEVGSNILEVSGGYIITGTVESTDGDVSGHHGQGDLWVIRIDGIGNLLWQKCYGGTLDEGMGIGQGSSDLVKQTADGGFILTTYTQSRDGDVSNPPTVGFQDLWVLKITATGNIQWDKCFGGNFADLISQVIINSDGTIFMSGFTYSKNLPGSMPGNALADAWALKLDASGNTIWLKAFGGSNDDKVTAAEKTPDGGFILAGNSLSDDGIVCKKHLFREVWLVKLDAAGNVQWSRTFGGNKEDVGMKMALTSSGECFVVSSSFSSDGDLTANRGFNDLWLTRFSFTGLLIYPSVRISSKTDRVICSGNAVAFYASAVDGGTSPVYQWKLNGVNIGDNRDSISISNMQNNDVVSCVLTSNSPCVDVKTVVSNNITVKVNPIKPPADFLPKDTSLCSYQRIELGPNSTRFTSYLWSDGSTTPTINVKGPGSYCLQVTDRFECIGRDTVTIFPKTCIEGVFVPNAFTPNRDGRNDQFMPIMNADVKAYKFVVYDRWGRVVFQTTTLNKGWDGKVNGLPYDTGVFAWQCQYQLDGELPVVKRGTVLLLR